MADGNIPFSCDITCFNGSEDQQAHDLEGTLLTLTHLPVDQIS